jgi:hypothetical protein
MPRRRRYTEHLGLQVTKSEIETVKQHAKAHRMTVSEYLRASAVRPLLEPQKDVPDDGPQAA